MEYKINMNPNNRVKKDAENFGKYLAIGIIFTAFNVFLMWLTIDKIKIPTLIASALVVAFIFMCKFYSYILVRLMEGGWKNFSKYASVDIVSIILNIALVWFLIDILKIPTVISSSAVVIGLFIGRFLVFKGIGLIK